ncbi:MAG: hypothetical protein K2G97_02865 [Oscillospiraceae bacterium]|nr:hypothetical protein [Oscillospiraceae bacterium]
MLIKDFNFEQTELLSKMLYTILFPKTSGGFDIDNHCFKGSSLELQLRLMDMIKSNRFSEAENLLFEAIDQDNGQDSLRVAVWFYNKLNYIDEKVLSEHDFSKQEVLEGIQEIEKIVMKA